ncbi:odorant receptor 49b-like isoform X2 [Cylas formicarius]|nr:odorant receptor 49b-like isoform X2 [Cylas formicarius]XP_060517792.1 odorant receptor 49b-like isoform X2 [Cylas formicarius]
MSSILKLSRYSMVLVGIWRFPISENQLIQTTYFTYSIFMQIFFFLLLTSMSIQFVTMTKADKNAGISPEQLFTTFAFIINCSIIQIKVILCQTKRLKALISYILVTEKELLRLKDTEIVQNHMQLSHFCQISNLAIAYFTFGVALSIILGNASERHQTEKYNSIYNTTLEKPFPYQLYYFGTDTQKHTKLLLVVNYFCVTVAGSMFVSTQVVFISCIIFASSILKSLQIKFRKMSAARTNLLQFLRKLILEHQDVIAFVGKLNYSVKYLILLEFLLNSVNMASVCVQLITSQRNMFLAFPIFYCVLFVTLTFMLGWSANEVKVQSLDLTDAVYGSPWYEENVRVRKMVLLIMMRTNRALTLTVGPFDAMTTQSALTIMKASYSYITLVARSYH